MDNPADRRRHPRFAANQAIRVTTTRGRQVEVQNGRMIDISQGGLSFAGPNYFSTGTHVTIEFSDCRVTGEVRRCKGREYASHLEFVTGVEISAVLQGEDTWKELIRQAD